jgi:hypothetical protein
MILRVLTGIVLVAMLDSCACRAQPGPEWERKMSKDLAGLSRLINLPQTPEEVWWETVTLGGTESNDWVLVAVLRFRPGILDTITKGGTSPESETGPTLLKSMTFDWYPRELRAMLVPENGETYRVQGKVLTAEAFARSPLLNGYAVKIGGTEQLFLYLYTT